MKPIVSIWHSISVAARRSGPWYDRAPGGRPMPISYAFDERARLIHVTASQCLTLADYLDLRRSVESDERIPTGSAVIFDMREVTSVAATGPEIFALGQAKDSVERRASRIAVVVKDPTAFGLTRIYDFARGAGPPLRVFAEIDSALHWILET
jgi:hypothetical protein